MAGTVNFVSLINDFDFVLINFSICCENYEEILLQLSHVSVVYG